MVIFENAMLITYRDHKMIGMDSHKQFGLWLDDYKRILKENEEKQRH
ncbi:MAG: hypothetical protein ACETV1_07695 [Candidatus Bathyarchaeia archaeon]